MRDFTSAGMPGEGLFRVPSLQLSKKALQLFKNLSR